MEVFDAREDFPQLKVQKESGEVIFNVHPVSKKNIQEINDIQKKVRKAGASLEKQFLYMLEMMAILCPDLEEDDIIDIPINKLGLLIGKMVDMSMGYEVPEMEKKIPEQKKQRSSRSRRRASA